MLYELTWVVGRNEGAWAFSEDAEAGAIAPPVGLGNEGVTKFTDAISGGFPTQCNEQSVFVGTPVKEMP